MRQVFATFMIGITLGKVLLWGIGTQAFSWAQTPDPKDYPLARAQVLLIEAIALTEKGLQDASAISKTVSEKLRKAGFAIASSPDQTPPPDATVHIKCEERQTWTGPSQYRSQTLATRLWKGPVCQLSYRFDGQTPNWKREIRTSFEDSIQASQAAGATNSGTFALEALNTRLQEDDFPLFLAAEWGQTDRLLSLFQQSGDHIERQKTILQLLGTIPSSQSFATLQEALGNPALVFTALEGLGQQGENSIPVLIGYLETATDPAHRLAAIRALGTIATFSKNPALFTQFMNLLGSDDPRIQTEAVKGLGNLGDRRAIQPLEKLNLQAWTNPSTHPDMESLREMLSWSLWQLSPGAHTGG